jgi:hypothetical protein
MELFAVCLLLTLTVVISCMAGRSHSSSALLSNMTQSIVSSELLPASNVLPLISSFEPEVIDFSNMHPIVPSPVDAPRSSSSVSSSSFSSTHHRFPSPYLRRVMLRNNSATCNDGTSAGYYIRHGRRGSKHWIVFLEGGWFCYSSYTCHLRWLQMRNLMSSAHWSEYRAGKSLFLVLPFQFSLLTAFVSLNPTVDGILSPQESENPYYFDANHVFIPYCSSDNWSGDAPAKSNTEFSFQGARILRNVVHDLLNRGLASADVLLLSGSSAGAGGVLLNLDRVAEHLQSIGCKVQVRGIADSGWFLDNQPFLQQSENAMYAKYLQAACREGHVCSPLESVRQGHK